MKNLLLSALFLGVALSCSNDDSPSENESSSILPTMISEGGDDPYSMSLKYNGNKLQEIGNSEGGKIVYKYDGNHIVKITDYDRSGEEDSTQEFTYTNGKLSSSVTKETYTSSTGVKTSIISEATYEWLDANHLKKTRISNTNSTPRISEYFFANGNLVKSVEQFGTGISAGTYTETLNYDTKNNPLKNILGFEVILDSDFAMNNVLTKDRKTQQGTNTIDTYTYTYTYEYNNNNYPTKRIEKYSYNGVPSKGEEVSTYTYNK